MKKFIIAFAILFSCTFGYSQTQTWVNGYTKSNGTFVQGHYRTNSNNTNWDNYSTLGNTNYYTGEQGSRARDYSNEAYNYGQNQTIYIGPRGGLYYINSNGEKVYVPKR